MSYSEHIVEKAKKELSNRRYNAEQEAKDRRNEVIAICPELVILEKEIADAGLEAIRAISKGANAKEYIGNLTKKNLAQQQQKKELLKQLGMCEDYLDVKYTCPLCKDKGYVNGRKCECYKKLLRNYEYEELCSCSPIKLSGFDSFNLGYYPDARDEKTGVSPREQMKQVLNYCKNWADDFNRHSPSVLMYGPTGLGKTHLSLAMAKAAIDKGYGVVYGSAQNLLNKLEHEKFGRSDDNTEERLLDCDLLILDDLGAEFSTQFTVSALYNIINTRMMTVKPVIVNTNLKPSELEAKYTQRIYSRIIGDYTPIEFFGRDIRQLKSM